MSRGILLVEDDEDIRETLREFLEDEGYEVTAASNGQEALDRLQPSADLPCFVLLDLMMPVMDGWTFLERIASDSRLARLPVIVSTSAPDRAPKGRQVIPKPVDLLEVLGVVRSYCSGERA